MRGNYFVFSDYEIEDLAKECGIKESELGRFADFFSFPQEWIHIIIEKFNDDLAQQKSENVT